MEILTEKEGAVLSKLLGHGGLFKTAVAGQKLMAGALNIPVAVMESAGEGGAWGIALLAAYTVQRAHGESLEAYLASKVFADYAVTCVQPDQADAAGFVTYLARYKKLLEVERAAVTHLAHDET